MCNHAIAVPLATLKKEAKSIKKQSKKNINHTEILFIFATNLGFSNYNEMERFFSKTGKIQAIPLSNLDFVELEKIEENIINSLKKSNENISEIRFIRNEIRSRINNDAYNNLNGMDLSTYFSLVPYFFNKTVFFLFWELNVITLICFLLFIGAVGKSAQLGLHTWLPDAMEGPTPVSALIHAATMVTAGVFLIIRCSPIFEYSPTMLSVITFMGALTAFFAATAGVVQNDLKKVIAYSTCSQLGYMVFSCGLSGYSVSLFHLANHAFFKALLFLSAGCVIHSLSDEQDMRRMGGLIKLLPLTYTLFLIGTLALIGFPFLTGFYSKDVILEIAYTKYDVSSLFSYWLGTLTAGFTAFYSFRLLYLTFLGENNAYKSVMKSVHESS